MTDGTIKNIVYGLVIFILMCIVAMLLLFATACTARSDTPPSPHEWVRTAGSNIDRWENDEAVCFTYIHGISCKWKERP